ncbi:MAG: hypothetical protein LBU99_07140 [Spirochaetaceae bacterium]|jgi:hypothetical protein|nr:hypothetical protein [Spirochaetaceae bacterium]
MMNPDELIQKVFESEVSTVRERNPPPLSTVTGKTRRGPFQGWSAKITSAFEMSGVIAAALVCCMTIVSFGRTDVHSAEGAAAEGAISLRYLEKRIAAQIPEDAEERFIRFFEMVSQSF